MKYLIILALLVCISPLNLFSQETYDSGRSRFYKVNELIELIDRARKAGISDEELKKLEIRDGDKEINVLDYIKAEELARLQKEKRLKEILSKKYLTVNDIYGELIKSEPDVIQKLREELVSER
ncbi:hypothetical protein KJ966_25000 [bacterium]|nr:hypothetical protein [bacterium]